MISIKGYSREPAVETIGEIEDIKDKDEKDATQLADSLNTVINLNIIPNVSWKTHKVPEKQDQKRKETIISQNHNTNRNKISEDQVSVDSLPEPPPAPRIVTVDVHHDPGQSNLSNNQTVEKEKTISIDHLEYEEVAAIRFSPEQAKVIKIVKLSDDDLNMDKVRDLEVNCYEKCCASLVEEEELDILLEKLENLFIYSENDDKSSKKEKNINIEVSKEVQSPNEAEKHPTSILKCLSNNNNSNDNENPQSPKIPAKRSVNFTSQAMVKTFREQSSGSYEAVEPIDFKPLKGYEDKAIKHDAPYDDSKNPFLTTDMSKDDQHVPGDDNLVGLLASVETQTDPDEANNKENCKIM
eukprot:GFUD01021431.1.p1 GENE.GFUD01021431.1~~GFUD01021431.1.p1  ORF type:complete len:354 (+),score=110.08 GFUD01021431.1:102-1163(+)